MLLRKALFVVCSHCVGGGYFWRRCSFPNFLNVRRDRAKLPSPRSLKLQWQNNCAFGYYATWLEPEPNTSANFFEVLGKVR
jgi:hypothetical protein